MKKSLSTLLVAALVITAPGPLATRAAAQVLTGPTRVAPVTGAFNVIGSAPSINSGVPTAIPGLSAAPTLTGVQGQIPTLVLAAPSALQLAVARPVAAQPVIARLAAGQAVQLAKPIAASADAGALGAFMQPAAARSADDSLLHKIFDNGASAPSIPNSSVLAGPTAAAPRLAATSGLAAAKAPAAVSLKKDGANGGDIVTIGVLAAALAAAAYFVSPTFKATVKRYANAAMGLFGLGAKKMETPEVMAERLTQQLEQEEKAHDALVQDAATEVARIELSITALEKQAKELQEKVDAILTDDDKLNDPAAGKPQGTLDVVNASIATAQASLKSAQATFEDAQLERTRFETTKAQKEAEIQATLNDVERARFNTRRAEILKQNTSGDRKKTEDRLNKAAQEEIAKGKGAQTSVDTDPDEIARKAVAQAAERKVKEALDRRLKELEARKKKDGANGGGFVTPMKAIGVAVNVRRAEAQAAERKKKDGANGGSIVTPMKAISVAFNVLLGVYAGLHTGWLALFLGASAVMGVTIPLATIGGIALGVFAEKVMKTSGAKTAGMMLLGGVIGFGAGVVAVGVAGYVGFAVASPAAAIGLGAAALVSSVLSGAYNWLFKDKKPAPPADDKKDGANGGDLATIGVIAAALAAAAYFVSPTFKATVKRYANAAMGLFGLGAKKMETPEVMAERLTQQLEQEEKAHDALVQDAATEVARIELSITALEKQAKELQEKVDAILTDDDKLNDPAAGKPQGTLDVVNASIATAQASLKSAQATFEDAQLERTRFETTKAQKEAEIQATLNDVERARFNTRRAEILKQNTSGDRKKTEDRLNKAAQEEIAKGKGAQTSVDTDPDEIARKAVAQAAERKVKEALDRRLKELEARKKKDGANGGYMDAKSIKLFVGAVGVGMALLAPFIGSAALVVIGFAAMAVLSPAGQKSAARTLFGVSAVTALIGSLPLLTGIKFGTMLGVGFGAFSFIVPVGIAAIMGVLLYRSAGASAPIASVPAAQAPAPAPIQQGPTAGDQIRDAAKATGEVAAKAGEVIAGAAEATAAASKKAAAAALEAAKRAGTAANEALNKIADKLETPEVKLEMYSQALDEQERLMDRAIDAAALEVGRLQAEMESPAFGKAPADVAAKFTGYLQESTAALIEAQAARSAFRAGRSLKIAEARRAFAQSKKDGANGGALGARDLTFFSAMGVLFGIGAAMLSGLWPIAVVAGLAAATILVPSRNLAGTGRAHDLAAAQHRAVAVGLALHAVYALVIGTAILPALIGAVLALRVSYWHSGRDAAQNKKDGANGGDLVTIGVIGAVLAVAAYFVSPTFKATVKRYANAAMGLFGLGAKKMETPEVMAERLTQQLEQEEKAHDALVQDAATEVARIELSITALEKQAKELQEKVDAILTDDDKLNDPAAGKPQGTLDVVNASIATAQASLKSAQATFEDAQLERTRFETTKAQKEAEIQATLNDVERARFNTRRAEILKQNTSGDRKKTEDRLNKAAQEEIAKGKGAQTSVDTDPDEIARKAVAQAAERKVKEALDRRLKELEARKKKDGANGGAIAGGSLARGLVVYALGAAFIAAVLGLVPGLATSGILDIAFRFLGVMAIWAGMNGIESGSGASTVRATLMIGAGVATVLAALGFFGPLGGLTAIVLGLSGFFFTLRGINRFASGRK